MRRLVVLLCLSLLGLVVSEPTAQSRNRFAVAATHSTSFDCTENPMVDGGTGWVHGLVDGLDWEDMRCSGGVAFGTQAEGSNGNCGGCTYNDSITLKRPSAGQVWPRDIDIRGRVFITSRSGWTGFHEVELWARATIIKNRARGYEAVFSVIGGTTYYEITKFLGPVGDVDVESCFEGCAFEFLNAVSCAGVNDGTYIRFTAIGNPPVLTQYTSSDGVTWAIACSGTATVTDSVSPYTAGMPGFGHWLNGNGAASTYGLSEWSAR